MPDPILSAESVRKVYRSGGSDVVALKGLDLSVAKGEFLAVMGPSGSGKTTLLNCLSGLDEIDEGRVLVEGRSIHELSDAAAHPASRRDDGLHLPGVQPDPGLLRDRERRASTPVDAGARERGAASGRVRR